MDGTAFSFAFHDGILRLTGSISGKIYERSDIMKQLKRVFAAVIACTICLCGAQGLMAADLKPVNDLSTDYRNAIENTFTWAKQGESYVFSDAYFLGEVDPNTGERVNGVGQSIGGDWLALSVGRYGLDDRGDLYLKALDEKVTSLYREQGYLDRIKTTEWHRIGLAVAALGGDPTAFGTDENGDLINLVADGVYHPVTPSGNLWAQGINGAIWGLILLDARDYEVPEGASYDRDAIIAYILGREIDGGGFALSATETKPDVDITGMALQALAPYYDSNENVKAAVDRALAWLSGVQKDDGTFDSWGTVNVESCAQVLVALCALEIDPLTDSRFIKNDNTVLDGIMQFYNSEDGGFRHVLTTATNAMATEQGCYALIAYDRYVHDQGRLYDFSDVEITYRSTPSVKKFSDVPSNAWYASFIYDLVGRGVINGITETTFDPEGLITRAQFAKMVASAFATDDELRAYEGKKVFDDVATNHWANASIAWAKDQGIVNGIDASNFAPEAKITREQLVTMLGRYAESQNITLDKTVEAKTFTDSNKIGAFAKEYVTVMQQAGIISGRDTGEFDPQGNARRSEAAKMFSIFLGMVD